MSDGEIELAFGSGQTRGGSWVLLTDRRLLWGPPHWPRRIGSLDLATVTSFQGITVHHRWAVQLRHEPISQRVHIPAHRFLWWEWGNAEDVREFAETTLQFSRRDTKVASRLRQELIRLGAREEPTLHPETPPKSELHTKVIPQLVRHPRLHRLGWRVQKVRDVLYRGELYWRWRLAGWLLFAVPLWFVNPWLTPFGVVLFEGIVIGLMHWQWVRNAPRRR